jgi:Zn-finger nucleic acid-binding protein
MNCPLCNIKFEKADKQGIEIDYCPKCRGVWLDRGELEKIIDRNSQFNDSRDYDDFDDDDDGRNRGMRDQKRRGGFLGEMFDF